MQNADDYKYWLERHIGWALIITFAFIPVLGWASAAQLSWTLTNWLLNFSNVGKIFGILGFMLFAINLVLSLRKTWLEPFFGGLNRVYIAHHITGGLALILLCFHPLFMALNYAGSSFNSAATFLLPRAVNIAGSFAEVQQSVALDSGIFALLLMVFLLVLTFYVKLPYNLWLFSHKFMGLAFVFAAMHVLFYNSALTSVGWLFAYAIIWTILGLAAFTYHSLFGGLWIKREPYQVKSVQIEGGNVAHIELAPIHKKISFRPGQFIFIRFLWADERDHVHKETHPFSIASSSYEANLHIRVKALGDFTKTLTHLSAGTIAEIEGAFGRFISSRFTGRDQVWVAGGIGITPFLSMAHSYTQHDPKVTLIYSVKSHQELLDAEFLSSQLPVQYPQFKFVPFVSDEKKAFLDANFIAEAAGGLDNKEIFLCGPPPMMKSLKSQLKQRRVPGRLIHDEAFSIS